VSGSGPFESRRTLVWASALVDLQKLCTNDGHRIEPCCSRSLLAARIVSAVRR